MEASGDAWLLRNGGLEFGGGLWDKEMGLSLGKGGLAWWQRLCWGSCGSGTWMWGGAGYCAFSFSVQRWCWLYELRDRQGQPLAHYWATEGTNNLSFDPLPWAQPWGAALSGLS